MKFPAILLAVFSAAWSALAAADPAAGPVTLTGHVRPLLQEFCLDCHNADKQKGDLNLLPLLEQPGQSEHREVWEKVAEVLESRDMPPEKKAQPSDAQRELLVKFIDGQLSLVDCKLDRNPGKVTIRRLNRHEYRNTIRDLLASGLRPGGVPD